MFIMLWERFSPIPDGGKISPSLYQFFLLVTSANLGINPQNFLDWCKLLNLNQAHPSKKIVFSGQILMKLLIIVMITSLIEMLELPNVGHMTTSTI